MATARAMSCAMPQQSAESTTKAVCAADYTASVAHCKQKVRFCTTFLAYFVIK